MHTSAELYIKVLKRALLVSGIWETIVFDMTVAKNL